MTLSRGCRGPRCQLRAQGRDAGGERQAVVDGWLRDAVAERVQRSSGRPRCGFHHVGGNSADPTTAIGQSAASQQHQRLHPPAPPPAHQCGARRRVLPQYALHSPGCRSRSAVLCASQRRASAIGSQHSTMDISQWTGTQHLAIAARRSAITIDSAAGGPLGHPRSSANTTATGHIASQNCLSRRSIRGSSPSTGHRAAPLHGSCASQCTAKPTRMARPPFPPGARCFSPFEWGACFRPP